MMDRSRMSVNRKFTKLPPKDLAEGKWANDELKRLKEAVHTVTKTTDSDDQPIFHGIYWPAVAELVKTRNIEKCRRKWLDKLCWSTTADNTQVEHWTISHDLKLITRLYNSGIMEECDVDWMELKSEYETNYAPQWLRLKWTKLKKGVPNYQQLSFEDVVDYLYREYVQTPPDETETGTSNNES
ncbi:Cyclin-D-binding Myb-like transcription factor 1 [Desmophyllum pertusum]|uniref:Cyclin-D-binding Myb-like transcription factor 1 n=1 Tax=Desmophyllum pertusum TaxID=174260 RepID=A0A9W9YNR4_9CNID|nr:Cyclin-D-binding Myb-like transcription factor 1 [Desmophyllum pertusum]